VNVKEVTLTGMAGMSPAGDGVKQTTGHRKAGQKNFAQYEVF
jgi:hypothetical protein